MSTENEGHEYIHLCCVTPFALLFVWLLIPNIRWQRTTGAIPEGQPWSNIPFPPKHITNQRMKKAVKACQEIFLVWQQEGLRKVLRRYCVTSWVEHCWGKKKKGTHRDTRSGVESSLQVPAPQRPTSTISARLAVSLKLSTLHAPTCHLDRAPHTVLNVSYIQVWEKPAIQGTSFLWTPLLLSAKQFWPVFCTFYNDVTL